MSMKPCWSCDTLVPARQGWCGDCWRRLGDERRRLILTVGAVDDRSLIGKVFAAVIASLRSERAHA
jgi:hypothetical protein